jgi:maleate cis-trans isomerase
MESVSCAIPWSRSEIQPMTKIYRIGQIVPSSNTTMETEIPAMLRAREGILPERFTFHSSRMRMKKVTKEELEAMDRDSDRCALELSDARVDVARLRVSRCHYEYGPRLSSCVGGPSAQTNATERSSNTGSHKRRRVDRWGHGFSRRPNVV